MQRRRDSFKDWWGRHLALDYLVAGIAAIVVWTTWPTAALSVADRFTLLSTVATIDGLVLAVSTFTTQMLAQASNPLAERIRRQYRHLINQTSRATLHSSLLCSAVAISSLFCASHWPQTVDTIAAFCAVLPVLRGLRAVDWFVIISLSEEIDDRPRTPLPILNAQIPVEHSNNEG